MSIRPIPKNLQQVAVSELNENPDRIQENLLHLREWLEKQPHLNARLDDQSLITFLRGCKWSLQRCKEKFDYFCVIRTLMPEVFRNRNPFESAIQKLLECGVVFPLPKEGPGGARILYVNHSKMDDTINIKDLIKLFFIITDILTFHDDNFLISGEILIVDYTNAPHKLITQITPTIAKKTIVTWMNAYPLRKKMLLGINTPFITEKFFNTLVLPFLSKKHQKRIILYTAKNNEKAYNHLPKNLFPEELGGENGSISKLAAEFKTKVESYKDWLLDEDKYVTNESLRPGKPKTYNEEFGVEGSFRKLYID